jgi:hypothetical protein
MTAQMKMMSPKSHRLMCLIAITAITVASNTAATGGALKGDDSLLDGSDMRHGGLVGVIEPDAQWPGVRLTNSPALAICRGDPRAAVGRQAAIDHHRLAPAILGVNVASVRKNFEGHVGAFLSGATGFGENGCVVGQAGTTTYGTHEMLLKRFWMAAGGLAKKGVRSGLWITVKKLAART